MNDKILFAQDANSRLYADARDTYYWLLARNKKIAKEFDKKIDFVEGKLNDKKKHIWYGVIRWDNNKNGKAKLKVK